MSGVNKARDVSLILIPSSLNAPTRSLTLYHAHYPITLVPLVLLLTIGARPTALACRLLIILAARLFHMPPHAHRYLLSILHVALVSILDISGVRPLHLA